MDKNNATDTPTQHVHIIQHEHHETPGHIEDWLSERGHDHTIILARHGFASVELEQIQNLIILGGAANIDDVPQSGWLQAERAVLQHIVRSNCPVLGICLGSQLLADALGAKVKVAEQMEVGWFELNPDATALSATGLAHLPLPNRVLEWHGRTFDVPSGGQLLASTAFCTHQAFIANGRHIGLQFHPEWTRSIVERVMASEPVVANGINVQSHDRIISGDFEQSRPFLWALLDHLVSLSGH